MSRPLPSTFRPVSPAALSVGRPIREGSDTGYGELDLVENLHWACGHLRSPLVQTIFTSDDSASAGLQAYVHGEASSSVCAFWVVPIVAGPWTQYRCYALVENTSGGDVATLRFELESDPYPGTYVDVSVPISTTAWTLVYGDLDIDPTRLYDTVRMIALKSSGEFRVHSVMIAPTPLSAIAAAAYTVQGNTWIPVDSTEVDGDSALSVALRRKQFEDVEFIRQSRPEVIVAWSENARGPTTYPYDETGTTSYVEQLRFPFRAGQHTKVRWAIAGYQRLAGAAVRLTTRTMVLAGTAGVTPGLISGWTSPYASNIVRYDSSSMAELATTPYTDDELIIELKAGYLMSLSAWLAP